MHLKQFLIFLSIAIFAPTIYAQSAKFLPDSTILFEYRSSSDSSCISREYFKYDKFGNEIDYLKVEYDYGTLDWKSNYHSTNTYDRFSNHLSEVRMFNYPDGLAEGMWNITNSYNTENELIQRISFNWIDSTQEWQYRLKTDYFNNSIGKADSSYSYRYNPKTGEWNLAIVYYNFYYPDGNLKEYYDKIQNDENSIWDFYVKWSFTYENDLQTTITTFNWDSTQVTWIPNSLIIDEYGINGRKELHEFRKWSNNDSTWILDSKSNYKYDNLGQQIYIDYMHWNSQNGTFDTIQKIYYEYFPSESYNITTSYKVDKTLGIPLKFSRTIHFLDSWSEELYNEIYKWDTLTDEWVYYQKECFYKSYHNWDSLSICNGDTLWLNGKAIFEEGEFDITFKSMDDRDSIIHIFVNSSPSPEVRQIFGDTLANEYSGHLYSVEYSDSFEYIWTVEGGNITSSPDSSGIIVEWGHDGTGIVICSVQNFSGCRSIPDTLHVNLLDTRIEENYSKEDFTIYPNPVSSILFVESSIQSPFIVEITSLKGQQVFKEAMEGITHQINLSSFQKGLYIITIRSDDFVITEKIIKL